MVRDAVKVIRATKAGEGVFRDERFWRFLSAVWTAIFIPFIIIDFFIEGKYEFLVAPMSAVYLGVLGLYAGTKEFQRWYENHQSRHPGEWFVVIWTAVVGTLFLTSFYLEGRYRVSADIVADYIMVLTIFALTQKSKSLHKKKQRKK